MRTALAQFLRLHGRWDARREYQAKAPILRLKLDIQESKRTMATPEPWPEYDSAIAAVHQHMAHFAETVQLLREALEAAERKIRFYESFDQEISRAINAALDAA